MKKRVVRSALAPPRPGHSPRPGCAMNASGKLEAVATMPTRPLPVETNRAARADQYFSPEPAYTTPALSSQLLVSSIPSYPYSPAWLFDRATRSNPIAFRSAATSGVPAKPPGPLPSKNRPSMMLPS
jgi:hypothetical protein